jgi:hypothetical protein
MFTLQPTANYNDVVNPPALRTIPAESIGLLPPIRPLAGYAYSKRKGQEKPETLWQARSWDATKRHYLSLGLCGICASQAAWGHQQGFTRVNPPCLSCLPVVLTFPVNEPGEWRSNSPRRGAPMSSGIAALRPQTEAAA